MCLMLPPKLSLAALFVVAAFPVYSQVTPAARQGSVPIVVGAGFSDFSLDWGPGKRMEGISAWVDWYPNRMPAALQGLGIEAAGHDINYGLPTGFSRMRQDTGEGGLIYSWNHYRNFRPYVKYLGGVGSIDFPSTSPTYTHDTFSVFSPGGGVEYHALGHIWIRGDYEYQFWHQFFGPHDLNPNGFTIGASYDFRPTVSERR
jgi:opacity protein-like surface antigen